MYEVERIFCNRRKRETTYEQCKNCTLITSPETERVYKAALTFFESHGFVKSKEFLEDARKELTVNNDPDGCIRASTSSLESTLKVILDRLEKPYPTKQQLTDLWNSIKREMDLGAESSAQQMKQLIGSLTGSVSALAGLRNSLSDAHGKGELSEEAYESYAELAMNLSATSSTFLIRRLIETKSPDE
jgi:HEPN domain-containing protein